MRSEAALIVSLRSELASFCIVGWFGACVLRKAVAMLSFPQQPVQLVNFFDEIVVAYSYSIHYQPIGSHLSSIEEENNFGQILIL